MTFLAPTMLYLLLVIPILLLAYILAQRRRQKYALRYASLSLVKEAMGRGPGIRRHIPPMLFIIGLTAMIVALSRPFAYIITMTQQGTVILTIDVSGSMRADDLKPNRMEAAKEAARIFVSKQPDTVRIGVVSFSGSATIVQPPTTDRDAILAAIDRLQTQRATAIGSGILVSLDAIFENPLPQTADGPAFGRFTPAPATRLGGPTPTPKVTAVPRGQYVPAIVILMSDGQSNTGPAPLDVVDQAVKRGVRIYTVGVGSENGVVLNFGGRSIRSRLDEATLKAIAEKTDAEYFNAQNETDLKAIYETLGTEIVFKPEKTEVTFMFTAIAGAMTLIAGMLSLLWFSRLP
jgi:Ca-activated chloride channel family protein